MPGPAASIEDVEAKLAPLREAPPSAAVLCDLDGTLAPIVARPGDAAVPGRARTALRAIGQRYAACTIVTGRRAVEAREIVGVAELTYVGIHGFELLAPGDARAVPAPQLVGHERDAAAFAAGLDCDELAAAGIRLEDKGPIVALHWRGAEDEAAVASLIDRVGAGAWERGLITHRGRMVLELRPPVALDKGTAVESLLLASGVRAALYAGDDRTDLDAFRALARLRDEGRLDAIVRLGVRSAEGPAELEAEADLLVRGPEALPAILETLAG